MDAVKGCPFCLRNGLLKTEVMQHTDNAYLIRNPYSPDTYLIIPEAHLKDVEDLPDIWWQDFKQLVRQIPNLGDFNVSINLGKNAGQTLEHLHFWIVPRTANAPSSGKGLVGLIHEVDKQK